MAFLKKKIKSEKIAKDQIKNLFEQAEKAKTKEHANKLVKRARELAMKFRLKLGKQYKRKFCKHCYSYLRLGKNVKVRTRRGKVIFHCLECKKVSRFQYK